jgi:hypothetical protein
MLTEDDLAAYVAWRNLSEALIHQGSIYSATFHAVPFFFRLLATQEPGLHYLALLFFHSMAWATQSTEEEPSAIEKVIDDTLRQKLAEHGRDWDAERQQEEEYRNDIHAALMEAIPQFRSFLTAPDKEIQELARELLGELTQASTTET